MNRTRSPVSSSALRARAKVCAETWREQRLQRAFLQVGRQAISPVVRSIASAPSRGHSSSRSDHPTPLGSVSNLPSKTSPVGPGAGAPVPERSADGTFDHRENPFRAGAAYGSTTPPSVRSRHPTRCLCPRLPTTGGDVGRRLRGFDRFYRSVPTEKRRRAVGDHDAPSKPSHGLGTHNGRSPGRQTHGARRHRRWRRGRTDELRPRIAVLASRRRPRARRRGTRSAGMLPRFTTHCMDEAT